MSINFYKLTPAPWTEAVIAGPGGGWLAVSTNVELDSAVENAKFIALARKAFDVMMRRGWHAYKCGDLWVVVIPNVHMIDQGGGLTATDPYSALIAAEEWYCENVEREATSNANLQAKP